MLEGAVGEKNDVRVQKKYFFYLSQKVVCASGKGTKPAFKSVFFISLVSFYLQMFSVYPICIAFRCFSEPEPVLKVLFQKLEFHCRIQIV